MSLRSSLRRGSNNSIHNPNPNDTASSNSTSTGSNSCSNLSTSCMSGDSTTNSCSTSKSTRHHNTNTTRTNTEVSVTTHNSCNIRTMANIDSALNIETEQDDPVLVDLDEVMDRIERGAAATGPAQQQPPQPQESSFQSEVRSPRNVVSFSSPKAQNQQQQQQLRHKNNTSSSMQDGNSNRIKEKDHVGEVVGGTNLLRDRYNSIFGRRRQPQTKKDKHHQEREETLQQHKQKRRYSHDSRMSRRSRQSDSRGASFTSRGSQVGQRNGGSGSGGRFGVGDHISAASVSAYDAPTDAGVYELGEDGMDDSSLASDGMVARYRVRTFLIVGMIVTVGLAASAAFIGLGFAYSERTWKEHFLSDSNVLVQSITKAWNEYEATGKYIHMASRDRHINASMFREFYEHAISDGLVYNGVSLIWNVTRDERPYFEQDTVNNYATDYPEIGLQDRTNGTFLGLEPDNTTETGMSVQTRSEQPFYFVVHLIEPVIGNEAAIDFDLYSSGARRKTIHEAIDTMKPALTDRLTLVQETDTSAYSVLLMHPGIVTESYPDRVPQKFCNIVIRIPDLLRRAVQLTEKEKVYVYMYDMDASPPPGADPDAPVEPQFLGGMESRRMQDLEEVDLETVRRRHSKSRIFEQALRVSNKRWDIVIIADRSEYKAEDWFIVFGGLVIFAATVCLSCWVYNNTKRVALINKIRSDAEAERSQWVLANARQAAIIEEQLNDYIAHEVRNPVAAAISACSFVKSAVHEQHPLKDDASRKATREDVHIIENSLLFVYDLLRNMLDMHKAKSKLLQITFKRTDILKDVLEPVDAMLYRRGCNFQVLVECNPPNMVVDTDKLRLKQILLNLARNSTKFIEKGFVKLKAEVVEETGNVRLSVEDSGPGIPQNKRDDIFCKFQHSLDNLSQGTGIGLFLCKHLTALLNGDIWLDQDYHSGIEGCPGTKFVIDLNCAPLDMSDDSSSASDQDFQNSTCMMTTNGLQDTGSGQSQENQSVVSCNIPSPPNQSECKKDQVVGPESKEQYPDLPDNLTILFVDDDLILRRLFTRCIKKVMPGWTVREASNGETALRMIDNGDEKFDIIFMDQYMASVEKTLLGTETVAQLRQRGVDCRICGLSANDVEKLFIDAGADCFVVKPFPCEREAMVKELKNILYAKTYVNRRASVDF